MVISTKAVSSPEPVAANGINVVPKPLLQCLPRTNNPTLDSWLLVVRKDEILLLIVKLQQARHIPKPLYKPYAISKNIVSKILPWEHSVNEVSSVVIQYVIHFPDQDILVDSERLLAKGIIRPLWMF